MEKLKVGLIGVGNVAELHLSGCQYSELVEVVAASEKNPDRLNNMVQKWHFRGYEDYEEMLVNEKLDIVCICTPPVSHCEITEKVASYGINILCEKPMALNLEDCQTMISACDQYKAKFYYGSSYRCLPACIKAKEMITQGKLGQIFLLVEISVGGSGPGNFNDLGPHHYPAGGPGGGGMGIVDHGIHMADVFCWLSGSDIDYVFGRGNYSGQSANAEYITMMFRNGAVGQLVYHEGTYPAVLPYEGIFSLGATWDVHGDLLPGGKWDPQPQCLYIHGEKGALRIFHYANKMFFFGPQIREEVSLLDRPNPGHFGLQMESFADSIIQNRPPAVTGQDGLRALRIILAAYESHEKKKIVKLF